MKRWGEASYEPAELSEQTVLDNVESAVFVMDRHGDVLYINPHAKEMFGLDESDIGTSITLGVQEDDQEQAHDLARRVLRGHPWDGTIAAVRSDGAKLYIRAQAVPLRHPSGAITGIVIFARPAMRRGTQREHDRFGLLERIGDRLAGSLELEATLSEVANTLVPQFADHCCINLYENDKLIRRVSTHAEGWDPAPDSLEQVGEAVSYPAGHFAEKAMRRQETVVIEQYHDEERPVPDGTSPAVCGDMGVTSVIAAPLLARGELLGVMNLALSDAVPHEDPHYDTFDRDFVGAIASRVAIALDNAMLFEAERSAALAFQHALLPREIPQLDGLKIAWRYFAAKPLESHGQGIQTQVGGDWYDVIPLSAGRVGIVIGDVEGRGARAAAMMGQLRAALRAFAQDDKSPSDILRKLDEWVRVLAPPDPEGPGSHYRSPIVTCTYMVYDAWSRQLSFANAGHDAPLLVIDGEVGRLEMSESGMPLGVRDKGVGGDVMFTEETRDLPPGATLILYTDGLVERRPRDDSDGEYWDEDVAVRMLREKVGESAHLDVEDVATVAADAVPGDIDDDVAILVIRAEEENLPVDERTFPAQPIMVSEARRMAAETFERWGIGEDEADLACLLVSEVVTNVVLHASAARTPKREMVLEGVAGLGGLYDEDPWTLPELSGDEESQHEEEKRFQLRLRRGASSIWVEVFDADLRLPRLRNAGENDEGGRGLYLVDQLTTRWGSRPTKDGKAVWFEIPTS